MGSRPRGLTLVESGRAMALGRSCDDGHDEGREVVSTEFREDKLCQVVKRAPDPLIRCRNNAGFK